MSISLVNIFKYYKGEPNQDKALQILQKEIERTNPELLSDISEFIQIWKNPDDVPTSAVPATTSATIAMTATATSAIATNSRTTARTSSVLTLASTALPERVQLDVPYFTQLDNENNPHGSCNVTSIAMCMVYLGHSPNGARGEQIEDELYEYCLDNGLDRHSPIDLAKVVKAYGYKDDFQENAKWGDVKKWLASGNPCVVHGYFTRSGHITAIVGYNEKGWIIHDPYGEWYEWGYDTSVSGKSLTYSYGMMKQICGSDGDLWIHYISK